LPGLGLGLGLESRDDRTCEKPRGYASGGGWTMWGRAVAAWYLEIRVDRRSAEVQGDWNPLAASLGHSIMITL
jgi:hypothetical protein